MSVLAFVCPNPTSATTTILKVRKKLSVFSFLMKFLYLSYAMLMLSRTKIQKYNIATNVLVKKFSYYNVGFYFMFVNNPIRKYCSHVS